MVTRVVLLGLACVCLGEGVVSAQAATDAPTVRIVKVMQVPTLGDFLAGAARDSETVVSGFRQYEPADGTPVSQDTTAYLSYDDDNLHVVFVCKDTSSQVRARLTRRDDIESDDAVFVYLDTFHDHRHAYLFAVNPLGIQADGTWTEGPGWNLQFDTLWYSDGRVVEDGFIASMTIPFKSLRFPHTPALEWGIALGRVIRRNGEVAFWPFVTQRIASQGQQFATLEGLEGISAGRNIQTVPYVATRLARLPTGVDPDAATYRSDREARAGLDAKVVIRDALTLDVTVNPDFSQVESDEPQVTINQRFEVFFPEKRPFFIENAGYFETPVNLFFSRRIRDPQAGARLTGKVGPWSLGALVNDDRHSGASGSVETNPRAVIGVGRLQREFRNQSTVGLLMTQRDAGAASNSVWSIDTRLRLGQNWALSGQAIHSDTREIDGRRVTGPAYWAELAHSGRHLQYATRYADRSPSFRADLGFVPRVDVRQVEQFLRYYWRPERSRVLAIGPDLTVQVNWNRQGRLQDRVVDVSFGADLTGPTGMGCRHVNAYELFQGLGFQRHSTDCGLNTSWLGWLELSGNCGRGSGISYEPAAGLAPFPADSANASLGLTIRPSPRIRFGQTYLYSRLKTRDEGSRPWRDGTRIFENHIVRTKITWQLTREWSLRGIVDYRAVLPNTDLVALVESRRLTADALLTYMVNPGTALYVGYTDTSDGTNASHPWRPGVHPAMVSTGRQLFMKVGYLVRF